MAAVSANSVTIVETVDVAADVHRPGSTPRATIVLAHGAGGDRHAVILRALADELCGRGFVVARIDLPYRRRRPKGPPSPSTSPADRGGIRAACAMFRGESDGPLFVGGHSYGGRQASMAVAEDSDTADGTGLADGLLLTSYPLHPPGKPEKLRTEHLPAITVPTLVVHGSSDPFGTTEEMNHAFDLVAGPTRIVELDKVGHDLNPKKKPTASLTADAVEEFLMEETHR
ncbi:alpha/beta fold hydrolase [Gordonia sp. zg691]|uniref:Alpha/beta fold hydrolase n=1 Tax=Gordonia jinghuaiqii TaxID=2758710 RepID=A0A7D7LSD2_9ACTN|nr:alpha/beta family hydrolase [Gordonia jinghuaiqii]MBD0859925.1 alpha/beta fold hydrolase [Gordonia jinghuaiqii]MCR5977090.1 alpha/beta hydrolase [Gordonia jinghuaiqii]QMT00301.1 alpha/beta fold hydrolase [Gordonia jinghuaiqii]